MAENSLLNPSSKTVVVLRKKKKELPKLDEKGRIPSMLNEIEDEEEATVIAPREKGIVEKGAEVYKEAGDAVTGAAVKAFDFIKPKKKDKANTIKEMVGEDESITKVVEPIAKEDLDKYYDDYLKDIPTTQWREMIEALKTQDSLNAKKE